MHRQKRRAQRRNARGGALDRVADIEQLRVHEDPRPLGRKFAGQLHAARKQQLQADLRHRARQRQPLPERVSLLRIRKIERDNQPALRFGFR